MAEPADARSLVPPSPLVVSYDHADPDSELLDWINDGAVSGVVIFRENAPTDSHIEDAVSRMRSRANGRFFVMIDEEGGRVRRLPDSAVSMPALRDLEHNTPEQVADAYRRVARRLKSLGIDTLLAPVADIGDPMSPWLRDRTYSDDPAIVASMLHTVIPAIEREGICATAKHFPGSRAVTVDPHGGAATDPTPPSTWEKIDAGPFRAAISAGVSMIMVGHQIMMGFDATRPACLSPLMIRVLLRERLGFNGLVLTDDLAMGAISGRHPIEQAVGAAYDAGANLILICKNRTLQRRAVTYWRNRLKSPQQVPAG